MSPETEVSGPFFVCRIVFEVDSFNDYEFSFSVKQKRGRE